MGEQPTRIENAIPRELAPWSPDYEPIRFVDALDASVSLPFEFFRNYKVIKPSAVLVHVNNQLPLRYSKI
jgi:hypothetical protein